MAATLQRRCSGGIIFVIITKIITKKNKCSKELFCNNFGQDGSVHGVGLEASAKNRPRL